MITPWNIFWWVAPCARSACWPAKVPFVSSDRSRSSSRPYCDALVVVRHYTIFADEIVSCTMAETPACVLKAPGPSKKVAGVRNRRAGRRVNNQSGIRRCQDRFQEGIPTMTIRLASAVSAATLALSLALAPAAFAQDKMGKDDGMKKDTMSKDGMKKDDGMMKKN